MSSHHIVREKQEPALIIMNLHGFDQENLGQLLEWNPTVVVNEAIYAEVNELGIKIDAIITTSKDSAVHHSTQCILTDKSPLEDALKYLVGEHYHAVNIIDNFFSIKDYALFAEDINLVIFCNGKRIFTVKPGFTKWQTGGQKVEIMHEVFNLQTTGLNKINDRIFETRKDGFYCLTFQQRFAFIGETV